MQTDPNWANFFYNSDTNKVRGIILGVLNELSKNKQTKKPTIFTKYLIACLTLSFPQVILLDFGACRSYPESFTDEYIQV